MESLLDDIKSNFTPHAVAAIAMYLHGANTHDSTVNDELQFLSKSLIDIVGIDEYETMVNELGL